MSSSTQGQKRNLNTGRLWVERQGCLMMICCLSTSAAHHMRQQSQCLLSIRHHCYNTWRTAAARCDGHALTCRRSPQLYARGTAMPKLRAVFQMQNKEMDQSSNCFLDVGSKPRKS